MADDMITAENLSRELLKSVFDAAFMDVAFDSDGDIIVKDGCKCYVLPDKDKRRILLLTQFGFKPSADESEKLMCANKINAEYIMVRAYATDKSLRFTYDIILDGGITRKAFVFAVKRFCTIPHAAVQDHGMNIVE